MLAKSLRDALADAIFALAKALLGPLDPRCAACHLWCGAKGADLWLERHAAAEPAEGLRRLSIKMIRGREFP